MHNPYMLSPIVVGPALLVAIILTISGGAAGVFAAGMFIGIMYVATLPLEERIDLLVLEQTQYRLISVDIADGFGNTLTRYRVEKYVKFPVGWGVWNADSEAFDNETSAHNYYDEMIKHRKELLIRLRTKYTYGHNAQLVEQTEIAKAGTAAKKRKSRSKKGYDSGAGVGGPGGTATVHVGVEPSQPWPR